MSRHSLFPPFAGVALADILANSVAIVIIMIVVMLMTRYEEEQDKLEQTEDVAVLLSRELATSFVMNALPTSPPAQLHDYVTSPLDRNPQHARMPIIELHNDFVRDYYTGRIYQRDELLRHDNALDSYLAHLAPGQLAAMRVDVYGIGQFYVAMSIFKAHNHQPRHWHFLGGAGGASNVAAKQRSPTVRKSTAEHAEEAFGDSPTAGDAQWPDGSQGALPTDVSLALVGGDSRAYPNDPTDASAGAGHRDPAQEYFELPGGVQDAAAQHGDRVADQPQPGQPVGDGAQRGGNRFRTATEPGQSVALDNIDTLDMFVVLRGLFAYMAVEQAAADQGLPSGLPRYDFRRDVLERAARLPAPQPEEVQLLRSLVYLVKRPRQPESTALAFAVVGNADVRGQALGLFVHEPLHGALWLRDTHQTSPVLEAAEITLQLGAHAEIHEGLRVALGRDYIILVPPPALPDPVPRWRIVTLVNAQRDDFVTGFVFAALDDTGRLILSTEENAVSMHGLRVTSHFPVIAFRDEFRQLLFYGLLAGLFAGGIVCRRWRRRRMAAA